MPGDIPLALNGVPGVLGLASPLVDIARLLLPFEPDPLVLVEISDGLFAGVLNEFEDVDRDIDEMVRRRGLDDVEALRLSRGPVLRVLDVKGELGFSEVGEVMSWGPSSVSVHWRWRIMDLVAH